MPTRSRAYALSSHLVVAGGSNDQSVKDKTADIDRAQNKTHLIEECVSMCDFYQTESVDSEGTERTQTSTKASSSNFSVYNNIIKTQTINKLSSLFFLLITTGYFREK